MQAADHSSQRDHAPAQVGGKGVRLLQRLRQRLLLPDGCCRGGCAPKNAFKQLQLVVQAPALRAVGRQTTTTAAAHMCHIVSQGQRAAQEGHGSRSHLLCGHIVLVVQALC